MAKGALYHLSVGISDNGYPVSDNITLNCEEVVSSHIKGDETAMVYPFRTYTMSTSHRNLLNERCEAQKCTAHTAM